ncbi:hypothetical protein D8B26_005488 [Coccidioides posadasii str. Silveira]|uniref:Uncharacterized protein n=2 Tax=Coccidioides posadasii TaxID=199306 RepID=E9D3L7_COCPS|nr:hypothetical protein CPC735_056580 [Coccidioides posadasii C735 delta SOWgp]EER24288.1 hypothetical protein CPC735_056580 [Coccidioides posadasii C735 delta SOWgp]EFW18660.1 conserved hypothetical protein [Coccidioides posadasii str. Silveira]QVM10836.1 hypothetical protein D8B26_005488 [Coccidioides posadasii str. Silveira]|eukprot:XP_003066433.1 hypothetical protein CPC735_056580 [Coccidioides posadasii C735 delta SOWgp]
MIYLNAAFVRTAVIIALLVCLVQAVPAPHAELTLHDGTEIPDGKEFIKCMKHKSPGFPDEDATDNAVIKACVGEERPKRHADRASVPLRDDKNPQTHWVESNFMKCMKKKHPNFPNEKVTNASSIFECEGMEHGKRSVDRGLISRSLRIDILGKSLTFKAECGEEEIPKNFKEAGPFRSEAGKWCDKMKKDVLDKGATTLSETLSDAVTKEASWFYRNKKVVLTLALAISPQGEALLRDKEGADEAYDKWCKVAFEQFGTKGKGCTKELGYYKDKIPFLWIPIGSATTTTVTDGFMNFMEKQTMIGSLAVDWSRP